MPCLGVDGIFSGREVSIGYRPWHTITTKAVRVARDPAAAQVVELGPGKGRWRPLGQLADLGLGIRTVGAIAFLLIPIVIVIVFSFNNPKGRFNFAWQGFTCKHGLHPFKDPGRAAAMATSITVAVIATIVATAIGTLLGLTHVIYYPRSSKL